MSLIQLFINYHYCPVKINFNITNTAIIFSKSDTIFLKTYLQQTYLNELSKNDTLSIYCPIISNTNLTFKIENKEKDYILLRMKSIQNNLYPIKITDTIHSTVNIILKNQPVYKILFK